MSTYITSSMYNGSVFVAPLSPNIKQKSAMQHAHTFFDVSMNFQGTYSSYNNQMKNFLSKKEILIYEFFNRMKLFGNKKAFQ